MNERPPASRCRWLSGATAVSLAALAAAPALGGTRPFDATAQRFEEVETAAGDRDFTFAHDHVLGTSLDLLIRTSDPRDARECHRRVLAEVERLRAILSTYDLKSEIRRVMAGGAVESRELPDVLDLYDLWSARTENVLHVNMAAVKALWQSAGTQDRFPDRTALRRAFEQPWTLNVDALGKAYIIDRAVAVARRLVPDGLLDIGGDLRAWGDAAFTIAVADPHNPADNAAPLATFELRDASVATSGGYARGFTIGGKRYSHLIDPRTLWPIDVSAAATVVAADCVTANALSTAACVLCPADAAALIARHAGMAIAVPQADSGPSARGLAAAANGQWPADHQVTLTLTLKAPAGGRKARRPYVAVWIEDARGKVIRTVTVWGTQPKYLRELTAWWQATAPNGQAIKAVTRATRDPGKYTIAWDGLDDAGKPVPRGDYTVVCEINREHGRHVGEKSTIACGEKKATSTMKATAESDESLIEYGPKGK